MRALEVLALLSLAGVVVVAILAAILTLYQRETKRPTRLNLRTVNIIGRILGVSFFVCGLLWVILSRK